MLFPLLTRPPVPTDNILCSLNFLIPRTAAISEQEIEESASSTFLLDRYFPDQAKEVVYGAKMGARTKVTAAAYRATQRIPAISVYCLLPDQRRPSATERGLIFMLQGSFPCNLYQLRSCDFWKTTGGVASSTEQSATVAALDYLYPARNCLLIDGGSTLTLTAVAPTAAHEGVSSKSNNDESAMAATSPTGAVPKDDGSAEVVPDVAVVDADAASGTQIASTTSLQIVGEGRTVSITGKFRALHENTGALPEITVKQIQQFLSDLESNHGRLALLATNTQHAMLGTVLLETTLLLRSALKLWALSTAPAVPSQAAMPSSSTSGGGGTATKSAMLVSITGMECDILTKLLTNSSLLEVAADPDLVWLPPPNITDASEEDCRQLEIRRPAGEPVAVEVKTQRHLAFHGVRSVLLQHCQARTNAMTDAERLRQLILGCRVAKDFGKKYGGVFFGQVVSVDRSGKESGVDDLYSVRFDDGDSEDYSIKELYGACR